MLVAAPGLTTSNQKLLGTKGGVSKSKDATRGSIGATTLLGVPGLISNQKLPGIRNKGQRY